MTTKAAPSRCPRLVAILTGALSASALLVCPPNGVPDDGPATHYEVSTRHDQEILSLALYGGPAQLSAQYRLYGDGRLLRELVNQVDRQPVRTDEARIEPPALASLMDEIVASDLPSLTRHRLQALTGHQELAIDDAVSVRLILHFISYHEPGEEIRAPYTSEVWLEAPEVWERLFPDVSEVRALNALARSLDAEFSESLHHLLHNARLKE